MPAGSRSSPAADAAAKSPGTLADGKPNAAPASEDLALFGHDTTERIIDVQPLLRGKHAGQAKVRLYRRSPDGQRVTEETDVFYPFFFLSDPGLLDGFPDGRYRQEALSGDGFFRHLVAFRSWGAFWDGVHHVEKRTGTHEGRPDELYLMGSPVRQYLLQSGRTCLKGMAPDDLHRLQLDIETRSTGDFPNPERPEDEIILVALSDNRGWERLLDRRHLPEPVLLEELVQVIREKDPDVIEGHNCFPAGTPVLTPNGYARIEDLGVGDPVLSHGASGWERDRVEHAFEQNCQGEMVTLRAVYRGDITSTPEHPHFGYRKEKGVGYHAASDFEVGDYLALPRHQVEDVAMDESFYLAGLIFADGHLSKATHRITFGNTHRPLVDWVAAQLDGQGTIYHRERAKATQRDLFRLRTHDAEAHARLQTLGIPAGDKSSEHAPIAVERVAAHGASAAASFLAGVIDGDGHVSEANGHVHIACRSVRGKTALLHLAHSLGLVAGPKKSGLALWPTKATRPLIERIQGWLHLDRKRDANLFREHRRVDELPFCVVEMVRPLIKQLGIEYNDFPLPRTTVNYYLNGRTSVNRKVFARIEETIERFVENSPVDSSCRATWERTKEKLAEARAFHWLPIREKRVEPFEGTVYNIQTGNHNYIADGILTHNCFAFDFDYIRKRCDMHGVSFAVGRDGSTPRTYDSSIRFAERMVDFPALKIAGRHIIDTYFRVMAYDVFKRDLPGYGLKDAARYFGFADESRTYVEGDAITALWEDDPERLREYALDDVRETRALAAHLSGSPFYLTQMLPMPYGQAARTGPASKIESLFIREYLRERRAFPRSQWGSQSVGGYTDIFVTGAVGPVVYADVESLYPSIMLADGIQPEGDTLDLFPRLLRRLTDLRFDAKRQMKNADDEDVRGELDARQSSYKVLINCFDPETEIMTVRGAKNVCDVEVGDRVYSLNPHTLEAEVKPVTRVHEQSHYEGEMVRLKNRFVDLLVTPNHRLLTNKVNGYRETGYQWREARDLFETKCRHHLPPRSALTEGHAPATFDPAARGRRHDFDFKTDGNGCIKDPRQQARWIPRRYDMNDWLELMGWFAGEGSLYTSKRYTSKRKDYGYTVRGVTHKVTLNNKTPHHRTAIRSLLVGINSREGGRGIAPVVKHGQRRIVDYEGSLHCVTVADNHTVLAGRNGTFNWVGQSFYGSLGFSLSTFNDFEEADKVTRRGQEILRQMIGAIKRRGGDVIESDTDGVFFVPPATYDGQPVRGDGDAEQRFTERLTGALPEGIRVGFDGRYRRMLSYKKKNYALLGYDGNLKFKGSSLVARSSERFGRRFVREAVRLLLEEDLDALHALYMDTRRMVEASDWPDGARSFARTETLKDTLAQYEADVESGRRTRTAPYELARRQVQQEGREVRKGDRISYYITGRGKGVTAFENCKLASEWDPDAPDENTAYYLDRLDRFTEKFEPFFEEHDFRRLFSPEDLFGFSAEGIELQTQRHEPAGAAFDDEVPF